MTTVDVLYCAICGKVIPPKAKMGLCPRCYRTTHGLEKMSDAGLHQDSPDTDPPLEEIADQPAVPSGLEAGECYGRGRYRLLTPLGRGGMGDVWLAEDLQLRRKVALKFLTETLRSHPRALELLKDEVLRGMKLTHPNIVRIIDWNEHPEEPVFVSMEYVDGGTLEKRMESQPNEYFTWVPLAPYAEQLCEALEHAHRLGIIHRDLKPRNLLISAENGLKLADFGLARATVAGQAVSSKETRGAGTLAYMSPQQRQSIQPTKLDDIYGLGATLYELLTGGPPPSPPFGSKIKELDWPEAPSIAEQVRHNGPCRVPPHVQQTILACLAYRPERRPRSVYEISERLGFADSGQTGMPTRSSRVEVGVQSPEGMGAWLKAHWWVPVGVVCALAVLVALLVGKKSPSPSLPGEPQSPAASHPTEPTKLLPVVRVVTPEQSAMQGDPVELRGAASGASWLQWLHNGQLVSGATQSVLRLPMTTMEDGGAYLLQARNEEGAATSGPVQLTIAPAQPRADRGWTNTLEQVFVRVPGLSVLFAVTETSIRDYGRFETNVSRIKRLPQQTEDHPVVQVSWRDATNYCAWLTRQERQKGRLGNGQSYRLPSNAEWDRVAGLTNVVQPSVLHEQRGEIRARKTERWWSPGEPVLPEFNFAGDEFETVSMLRLQKRLPSYRDGFATTAPVGSPGTNEFGLHHLAGNVSEWCGDLDHGTCWARGAAWDTAELEALVKSFRWIKKPDDVSPGIGFRMVLDLGR